MSEVVERIEPLSMTGVREIMEDGWRVFGVSIDAARLGPSCEAWFTREEEAIKFPITLDAALELRGML